MYTSQELNQIASEAPQDTLEETIESMAQKEIAQLQAEFQRKKEYLTGEEFAEIFYERFIEHPEAEKLYEEHITQNIRSLRVRLEQEIEALYILRDYRTSNLHDIRDNSV